MRNRIVFCPECRQEVEYSVKENTECAERKGEIYEFASRDAYCKKCGGEVYVAELEDANLQAFNDAYHQSHKDEGMLT